jgi:hypothetical protein
MIFQSNSEAGKYIIVDLNTGTTVSNGSIASAIFDASNLGNGVGVYASKINHTLNLKSLKAGTGISLTPSSTGITISSTSTITGTTGSVLFFGGSGTVTQNNTNFKFDNTNAALNVGLLSVHARGTNNTFVGQFAGNYNLSGAANTAFGAATLFSLTNGNNNVAVGQAAALALTTGVNNVAIGSQALVSNIVGGSNLAIGANALQNTTGDENTAIGTFAGDNITSGDKNVIIGYSISAPSPTADGQLSIQNAIFGTGNINNGTAVSAGNIGIYATSPSARLQVRGAGTTTGEAFRVENSTPTTRFSVLDNGTTTITGDLVLGNSSGTGTDVKLTNPKNIANLAHVTVYPNAGTNVQGLLSVIPKGTGANGVRSQLVIYNTDFIADSTNYEYLSARATGTDIQLVSGAVGTGTFRPLQIYAGTTQGQIYLATTGGVGIGTTSPTTSTRLDVRGISGGTNVARFANSTNSSARFLVTDAGVTTLAGGTSGAVQVTGAVDAIGLNFTANNSGLGLGSGGHLDFYAGNGATRVARLIASTGNLMLGSGTITSNTKLDVIGLGTTTGNILRLANNSNVPVLTVKDNKSIVVAGTSGNTITLSGTTGYPGAQYLSDYSASYTSRSIPDVGYVDKTYKTITIDLSANQIKAIHTTPVDAIPAPGANKYLAVVSVDYVFKVGGTLYTTSGGTPSIGLYYNSVTSSGVVGIGSTLTQSTDRASQNFNTIGVTSALNLVENLKLTFKTASSSTMFLNGTGTLKAKIIYQVVEF